jgi:hypothetical protein
MEAARRDGGENFAKLLEAEATEAQGKAKEVRWLTVLFATSLHS